MFHGHHQHKLRTIEYIILFLGKLDWITIYWMYTVNLGGAFLCVGGAFLYIGGAGLNLGGAFILENCRLCHKIFLDIKLLIYFNHDAIICAFHFNSSTIDRSPATSTMFQQRPGMFWIAHKKYENSAWIVYTSTSLILLWRCFGTLMLARVRT